MKQFVAFDSHKHYTLVEREVKLNRETQVNRIEHEPGAILAYLNKHAEAGTTVAVEATGNWYWIVDEIEAAKCLPALVHPYKAKVMLGCINKTDRLDVRGMNRLQRAGTLPTVWIPPAEIRDLRDLTRSRMFMVRHQTRLKNRILAALARYGWKVAATDSFGTAGRKEVRQLIQRLPATTQSMTDCMLQQLEGLEKQIEVAEDRIKELIKETPEMQRLMTIPGIGRILAAIIMLEIGDVSRFPTAAHLASYGGTTPRVHASGGKIRFGRLRPDVNRYLQWALIEAANSVCRMHRVHGERHVCRVYTTIAKRRGHGKAIGAVARHLAESAFYILARKENYREPQNKVHKVSSART